MGSAWDGRSIKTSSKKNWQESNEIQEHPSKTQDGPNVAAALVLVALLGGVVTTTRQAAIARRERAEAIGARTLAEARLNDIHALAGSMLFEVNDDVKDLSGGTKAREALIRLGQQYLNKEAAVAETEPRRRQELAEAFLKMGDLQGAPGESNFRDLTGARTSYSRQSMATKAAKSDVIILPLRPRNSGLFASAKPL